jgi:hypothetical protein
MKYDSEGCYHNPELRIEHTRLERIDISDDNYNHLIDVYAEIADMPLETRRAFQAHENARMCGEITEREYRALRALHMLRIMNTM